jgi:hypothetical protein
MPETMASTLQTVSLHANGRLLSKLIRPTAILHRDWKTLRLPPSSSFLLRLSRRPPCLLDRRPLPHSLPLPPLVQTQHRSHRQALVDFCWTFWVYASMSLAGTCAQLSSRFVQVIERGSARSFSPSSLRGVSLAPILKYTAVDLRGISTDR